MKRSRTVVHNATKPPLEIKIAHLRAISISKDCGRAGKAYTGLWILIKGSTPQQGMKKTR
jgi:hypothetical protein